MTLSDLNPSPSPTPRGGDSADHPLPGEHSAAALGRAHSAAGRPETHRALALALVLTAGLSLVLALFVGIAVNSGPNGIRLAVAGPPAAVEQIAAGVTALAGPDSFQITVLSDEAAARAALEDRSADGAIVIGATGPTVLTAGAGSPAITQLLTTAAGHLANPAAAGPAVVDVVALPSGDSRGVGLAAGSFPMIIAGLVLGAVAALALRSRWVILSAIVGGAVTIAVSFAGILAWLGVSGGHFWAESSAIALMVAASALVVAGLVRLMGPIGAGVGALLLVVIGNPLSGIATSPRLLPGPWGEFGQWLPTGAGGTLLRTVAYFPAAPIGWPVLVLLSWAALGALGVIFGRAAQRAPRSASIGENAVPSVDPSVERLPATSGG